MSYFFLHASASTWQWRPSILLVLLAAGVFYSLGWLLLRRRTRAHFSHRRHELAASWRPLSYWAGLLVVGLALLSPIDHLGEELFIMHMVQHILLVMIAPPLLLIANPLPFILWGLPPAARRGSSLLLAQSSPARRLLAMLTQPAVSWFLFVLLYLGWHDPGLYNAALRSNLIHDLEHVSFFLGGMLVWWHITGAAPRLPGRLSPGARAAFAMALVPPNMFAGLIIAFARQPIYNYYIGVPRLWGMTAMQDQQWSGVIMWVPGSMMFILAALILLFRQFPSNGHHHDSRGAAWSSEEAMLAPGIER